MNVDQTEMSSGDTFAIKDIPAGSQLFEDYTTFSHPEYLYELLEQYSALPSLSPYMHVFLIYPHLTQVQLLALVLPVTRAFSGEDSVQG